MDWVRPNPFKKKTKKSVCSDKEVSDCVRRSSRIAPFCYIVIEFENKKTEKERRKKTCLSYMICLKCCMIYT